MSENEYKKDLSNFEDILNKTIAKGEPVAASDLRAAFIALKNYLHELNNKIENIKKE